MSVFLSHAGVNLCLSNCVDFVTDDVNLSWLDDFLSYVIYDKSVCIDCLSNFSSDWAIGKYLSKTCRLSVVAHCFCGCSLINMLQAIKIQSYTKV